MQIHRDNQPSRSHQGAHGPEGTTSCSCFAESFVTLDMLTLRRACVVVATVSVAVLDMVKTAGKTKKK